MQGKWETIDYIINMKEGIDPSRNMLVFSMSMNYNLVKRMKMLSYERTNLTQII
jgi:hypothetical protein